MPVESCVLHCDDCFDQVVGDLADRYGDPTLHKEGPYRSSVIGQDPRYGGGFIGLEALHLGQVLRDGKEASEKNPDEEGPGDGEDDPEFVFGR